MKLFVFMTRGFKIAIIFLVIMILAWCILLINTFDITAHSSWLLDKIEAIN